MTANKKAVHTQTRQLPLHVSWTRWPQELRLHQRKETMPMIRMIWTAPQFYRLPH